MPHDTASQIASLACPVCKTSLRETGAALVCTTCGGEYRFQGHVRSFITRRMYGSAAEHEAALKIIEFWGSGWAARLSDAEHAPLRSTSADAIRLYAEQSVVAHRTNQSTLARIVDGGEVRGKTVLNIGSGAGTEALLLAHSGADCIAMDITHEAAEAAQALIQKIDAKGFGIQADARFIPIQSGSIDAVYSSGVLHHSPNIEQSIREIHRVLRPDGRIYIMLYATWSILFMQPRLFGFMQGRFSRRDQEDFVSANTERAWETANRRNPLTMTFTTREVQALFSEFRDVTVDKRVFSVRQIKYVGRGLAALGLVNALDRGLKFLNPVVGACLFIEGRK